LNSAVCTLRFLRSLIHCHPHPGRQLKLRFAPVSNLGSTLVFGGLSGAAALWLIYAGWKNSKNPLQIVRAYYSDDTSKTIPPFFAVTLKNVSRSHIQINEISLLEPTLYRVERLADHDLETSATNTYYEGIPGKSRRDRYKCRSA